MTIADSFKKAINNVFIHTIFLKRDRDIVLKTLKTKAHDSNTFMLIPPIQGFTMEKVDDTHDKITFTFDDYAFDGIVTWKLCEDEINVVFMGIE